MDKIRYVGYSVASSFNKVFNMHVFVEALFTESIILMLSVVILPNICKLSTMVFLPTISLALSLARLTKIWKNYWTPLNEKGKFIVEITDNGEEIEYFQAYEEYEGDNYIDNSLLSFFVMVLRVNFSIILALISILLLFLVVVF